MNIEDIQKDKEVLEEKLSELNEILKNENIKYADLYKQYQQILNNPDNDESYEKIKYINKITQKSINKSMNDKSKISSNQD